MMIFLGVVFIICGFLFKVFPPKKINSIVGYRTRLSMKNQDTWKEAHRYSGNTFIIMGLISIPLEFIFSELNITYKCEGIIILIYALIMIIVDEIHLRKVFNNDGSRKL